MTDPVEQIKTSHARFIPAYAILCAHLIWLFASSLRLDVLLTLMALSVVALKPTRGGAIVAIVLLLLMAVGNILSFTAVGLGHEKSLLIIGHLMMRLVAIMALVWGMIRQPDV